MLFHINPWNCWSIEAVTECSVLLFVICMWELGSLFGDLMQLLICVLFWMDLLVVAGSSRKKGNKLVFILTRVYIPRYRFLDFGSAIFKFQSWLLSVCEISFLGHSRFSDKIGSDFQQKNRDRDREWESGVAFAGAEAGHRHAARVNPDSHSRSRKFGIGSRFGSRFGSDFQNREWESGVRNSERQSCYNGHSRLGIEESGVAWKKPLPNPLPIPIGSQNFAHCRNWFLHSTL